MVGLLAARAHDGQRIFALQRSASGARALGGQHSSRTEVLCGDITKPFLGLTPDCYAEVQASVTRVLHCAGLTRFSAASKEAEAVNIEGTRRVLDFARGARRLACFAHVSTTCVAGKRTGTILESELEHAAGFVNAYEWSKYEAERLVRAADIPWSVLRLSTLIGDASGLVRQWNAVHRAVALVYRGLAPVVPGYAETLVDLIPDGFAANCVYQVLEGCRPGRTYHICAGADKSMRLDELLQGTARTIESTRPGWRKRAIEPPVIVDEATFELFGETARDVGNVFFVNVYEALRYFLPQLLYPKEFDRGETIALVGDEGVAPALGSYWGQIVASCIRTPWNCQR